VFRGFEVGSPKWIWLEHLGGDDIEVENGI